MHRTLIAAALVAGILAMTGCDDTTSNSGLKAGANASGRVGVIDLDQIAKGLGKDEAWRKEIGQLQESLNAQLVELKETQQKEYDELEKQFGDEPTDEQKKQLREKFLTANQLLATADRQLGAKLSNRRAELVNSFREQVKPFTQKVADEKGLSIVFTVGPRLYVYDDEADITNDVLQAAAGKIGGGTTNDD